MARPSEHDIVFKDLRVDGADEFPGVVESDVIVSFLDTDELSDEPASCEDAVVFPTNVS